MVVKQTTRIDLNHHKLITYLMALRRLNTGYEIATIIILLSIVCTKISNANLTKKSSSLFYLVKIELLSFSHLILFSWAFQFYFLLFILERKIKQLRSCQSPPIIESFEDFGYMQYMPNNILVPGWPGQNFFLHFLVQNLMPHQLYYSPFVKF